MELQPAEPAGTALRGFGRYKPFFADLELDQPGNHDQSHRQPASPRPGDEPQPPFLPGAPVAVGAGLGDFFVMNSSTPRSLAGDDWTSRQMGWRSVVRVAPPSLTPRRAFTLLELLVVIAILAILMALRSEEHTSELQSLRH